MSLRNMSRPVIFPVLAAILVGCQVTSPSGAPGNDEKSLNRANGGRVAEPARVTEPGAKPAAQAPGATGTTGAQPAVVAPLPGAAIQPGTGQPAPASLGGVVVTPTSALDVSGFKEASEAAQVRAALLEIKGNALAAEPAQAVDAAKGARVQSADGTLTATIPAGALSQNAQIKITPLDPAMMSKAGVYVPGILFAADLGGATLTPGTSITVSQRVEASFVEKVKAFDKDFAADRYNLRQDADGNWLMEMPIKGPTLGAGPAPEKPLNPNLLEFGGLPGVAATTQVGGRTLMAADVDVDNQALLDATRDASAPGCSIPLWLVIHNESLGIWGCGAVNHDEICWGEQTPPTETYVVKAKWLSDDDDFKNVAAAGVAVHADYVFEQWWNIVAAQGARDMVTDTTGQASTFTSLGSQVTLTASHAIAPSQTAVVRANGPFTATFELPHYMPVITLKVTKSDIELPASLEVKYTLNGEARTAVVATGGAQGQLSGDMTFKVKVPGEAYYPMTVLDVRAADGVLQQPKNWPTQSKDVRANGSATFTTELRSTAAK